MHTIFMRGCILFICLGATTDRYKGFPMPGWRGRVTMFMDFTATNAVMLLSAIFVPIVHKNSFKRPAFKKNINNPFKSRQLLFLLGIYILPGKQKHQ
jgi:hypothetical protein